MLTSTDYGTIAHRLMELLIKKRCNLIQTNAEREQAIHEYRLIEDKITPLIEEEATKAADKVVEIYHSYSRKEQTTIYTEQWLHYSPWIPEKKGIADVLIVTPTRTHIIDLKTGMVPVEPDCEQMRLYAAGTILHHSNYSIKSTILQHGDVKTMTFDPNTIITWAKEVGDKKREEIRSSFSKDVTSKLYDLIEELEGRIDHLDGEELLVLSRAESLSKKAKDKANKRARDGEQFEHFELKPSERTRTTSLEGIRSMMIDRGHTLEEFGGIGSATLTKLKAVIGESGIEEAYDLRLLEKYETAETLKKIK